MAITFDAATAYPNTEGSGTTHNLNHTCTGANRLLVVGFMHYTSNTDVVTDVTYNSVSMARAATEVVADARLYLYFLRGPASGSNVVEITLSSARSVYGGFCSYAGVKQSGAAPHKVNTQTISGQSNIGQSVTTTEDNCWLVSCYLSDLGRTMTAGSNTFERLDHSAAYWQGDSNADQTPAGLFGQNINLDPVDDGALCMAAFIPSVAATFIPKMSII